MLQPAVAAAAAAVADDVAEVDGGLKVAGVLVAACRRAVANHRAKVRAARVAAEIGLGEQQQVDALGGGAAREGAELLQRRGPGGLRAGGGGAEPDGVGGHCLESLLLFETRWKMAVRGT